MQRMTWTAQETDVVLVSCEDTDKGTAVIFKIERTMPPGDQYPSSFKVTTEGTVENIPHETVWFFTPADGNAFSDVADAFDGDNLGETLNTLAVWTIGVKVR